VTIGIEDQFVQGDAFGHRRVERMEFVLALAQRLDGSLAVGDVVVHAEHTDGFALAPGERHLGRTQPDGCALRRRLRFFVIELGLAVSMTRRSSAR
jgi:hypothetical protein